MHTRTHRVFRLSAAASLWAKTLQDASQNKKHFLSLWICGYAIICCTPPWCSSQWHRVWAHWLINMWTCCVLPNNPCLFHIPFPSVVERSEFWMWEGKKKSLQRSSGLSCNTPAKAFSPFFTHFLQSIQGHSWNPLLIVDQVWKHLGMHHSVHTELPSHDSCWQKAEAGLLHKLLWAL